MAAVFAVSAQALTKVSAAPQVCGLDPSSYANCQDVKTNHFHLDIRVDFIEQAIGGYNTLSMTSLKDGLSQVVLDFQGMTIIQVEQLNNTAGSFVNITHLCTTYTD